MAEVEQVAAEQNAPSVTPTPIGEILMEPAAPVDQVADKPQPAEKAAPESGNKDERYPNWSDAALQQERTKRKAFQERARQLEEENQALLAATQTQAQPENNAGGDDFWSDPERTIKSIHNQVKFQASEMRARHRLGNETYEALDAEIGRLQAAGHPDIPLLSEKMQAAPDPMAVVIQWWDTVGLAAAVELDRQQGRQNPRRQAPAPVYPSNIATARNVGARRGPVWTGQTPLEDIFGQRDIFKRERRERP